MCRKRNSVMGLAHLLLFLILHPMRIAHAVVRTRAQWLVGWLVDWAQRRVIFGNGRAGSVAVAVIYLREGSLRSTVVLDVLVGEQCWCCTWNSVGVVAVLAL